MPLKIRFRLILIIITVIEARDLEMPFFLTKQCPEKICSPNKVLDETVIPALFPIDIAHNPCQDFYQYACAEWSQKTIKPDYEPVWSPWIATAHELYRRQTELLRSQSELGALNKAQKFYESCSKSPLHELKYLDDLKMLINNLYDWPLNVYNHNYTWLMEVMTVAKLVGVSPIIRVHVDLDFKNTSQQIIYIEPGTLVYPRYILLDPIKYKLEIQAYEKWIYEVIKHLYLSDSDSEILASVRRIINFEINLALLTRKPRDLRLSLAKLSKKTGVNWQYFLDFLFSSTGHKLNKNQIIAVRNYNYLKKVFNYIQEINSEDPANYIIWCVIKELSRDTTKYMRNLSFLVDKAILGVQSDLDHHQECITKTIEYFNYALVPQYLQLYTNLEMFQLINQMTELIKNEFVKLVEQSSWIGDEARRLSVEKIHNINVNIGFPEWTMKESQIELYYEKIIVSDDYFENILRLKKFRQDKALETLFGAFGNDGWPSTVFEVNAYYSVLQNAIFIPLGLLAAPFFDSERPQILNYGALGALIGHELSHALDTSGRKADKDGIITQWWSQNDIETYEKRVECFKEGLTQQSSLGESIADSIGLEIGLNAYKTLKKRHLTSEEEKLYFTSYSQMWCELTDKSDIFGDEDYAPVKERVEKCLNNNADFIKTFNCTLTDDNRCLLW